MILGFLLELCESNILVASKIHSIYYITFFPIFQWENAMIEHVWKFAQRFEKKLCNLHNTNNANPNGITIL
jgi:hypothetical protein